MDRIKLFCLPYAGGSASIYMRWRKYFENLIEIVPVELKGRGCRFNEKFYHDFDEAVEDIYYSIKSKLNEENYALFGHSMGGLIIHDLIKKLNNRNYRPPKHVFFSGCIPPHIKKDTMSDLYNNITDEEKFKQKILSYEGTPNEVFEDKELKDIFIPIIKADYKIIETRKLVSSNEKYDFNITILVGKNDDSAGYNEMMEWNRYTSKTCNIFEFEGGHFFINENSEKIVKLINTILNDYNISDYK